VNVSVQLLLHVYYYSLLCHRHHSKVPLGVWMMDLNPLLNI